MTRARFHELEVRYSALVQALDEAVALLHEPEPENWGPHTRHIDQRRRYVEDTLRWAKEHGLDSRP